MCVCVRRNVRVYGMCLRALCEDPKIQPHVGTIKWNVNVTILLCVVAVVVVVGVVKKERKERKKGKLLYITKEIRSLLY